METPEVVGGEGQRDLSLPADTDDDHFHESVTNDGNASQMQKQTKLIKDDQIAGSRLFEREKATQTFLSGADVVLSRCEQKNCCQSKVHCPFCDVDHFKPSLPARVRDHLNRSHFQHAVYLQGLMIVKCFRQCTHPAGHYHCPLCESEILKRVAFTRHLVSHIRKLGYTSTEAVQAPHPKQPGKVLFNDQSISVCNEKCKGSKGKHYHCPLCGREIFTDLPPLIGHVWRCQESRPSWRQVLKTKETLKDLLDARLVEHITHPAQVPEFKVHKSIVRNLSDLPLTRCTDPTCCSGRYHCPLCPSKKLKPNYVGHMQNHLLSHLRSGVMFKEYYILICYGRCDNPETNSLKIEGDEKKISKMSFHFHCPLCGRTRVRKEHFVKHLKLCWARRSRNGKLYEDVPVKTTVKNGDGEDDEDDDKDSEEEMDSGTEEMEDLVKVLDDYPAATDPDEVTLSSSSECVEQSVSSNCKEGLDHNYFMEQLESAVSSEKRCDTNPAIVHNSEEQAVAIRLKGNHNETCSLQKTEVVEEMESGNQEKQLTEKFLTLQNGKSPLEVVVNGKSMNTQGHFLNDTSKARSQSLTDDATELSTQDIINSEAQVSESTKVSLENQNQVSVASHSCEMKFMKNGAAQCYTQKDVTMSADPFGFISQPPTDLPCILSSSLSCATSSTKVQEESYVVKNSVNVSRITTSDNGGLVSAANTDSCSDVLVRNSGACDGRRDLTITEDINSIAQGGTDTCRDIQSLKSVTEVDRLTAEGQDTCDQQQYEVSDACSSNVNDDIETRNNKRCKRSSNSDCNTEYGQSHSDCEKPMHKETGTRKEAEKLTKTLSESVDTNFVASPPAKEMAQECRRSSRKRERPRQFLLVDEHVDHSSSTRKRKSNGTASVSTQGTIDKKGHIESSLSKASTCDDGKTVLDHPKGRGAASHNKVCQVEELRNRDRNSETPPQTHTGCLRKRPTVCDTTDRNTSRHSKNEKSLPLVNEKVKKKTSGETSKLEGNQCQRHYSTRGVRLNFTALSTGKLKDYDTAVHDGESCMLVSKKPDRGKTLRSSERGNHKKDGIEGGSSQTSNENFPLTVSDSVGATEFGEKRQESTSASSMKRHRKICSDKMKGKSNSQPNDGLSKSSLNKTLRTSKIASHVVEEEKIESDTDKARKDSDDDDGDGDRGEDNNDDNDYSEDNSVVKETRDKCKKVSKRRDSVHEKANQILKDLTFNLCKGLLSLGEDTTFFPQVVTIDETLRPGKRPNQLTQRRTSEMQADINKRCSADTPDEDRHDFVEEIGQSNKCTSFSDNKLYKRNQDDNAQGSNELDPEGRENEKVESSNDTAGKEELSEVGNYNRAWNQMHEVNRKYLQNPAQCYLCDFSSNYFPDLTSHLISYHGCCPPLTCDICEEIFYRISDLQSHLNLKHGPQRQVSSFSCLQCQKSFLVQSQLDYHMSIMHKSDPAKPKPRLICCVCDFVANTQFEMTAHRASHKKEDIVCKVCGKQFQKAAYLQVHMEAIHTKVNSCICSQCGKHFSHLKYLTYHMKRHTSNKKHVCPICGWRFFETNTLRAHLETHKPKEERKYVFTCSYCGAKYSNKTNFRDHLNKHTGNKPHKCLMCDKRFAFRSMLTRHKAYAHSTERPFTCDICQKSFRFNAKLAEHLVTHTGISNHVCSNCHKAFGTKSSLKQHFKKCKGGEYWLAKAREATATVPAEFVSAIGSSLPFERISSVIPAAFKIKLSDSRVVTFSPEEAVRLSPTCDYLAGRQAELSVPVGYSALTNLRMADNEVPVRRLVVTTSTSSQVDMAQETMFAQEGISDITSTVITNKSVDGVRKGVQIHDLVNSSHTFHPAAEHHLGDHRHEMSMISLENAGGADTGNGLPADLTTGATANEDIDFLDPETEPLLMGQTTNYYICSACETMFETFDEAQVHILTCGGTAYDQECFQESELLSSVQGNDAHQILMSEINLPSDRGTVVSHTANDPSFMSESDHILGAPGTALAEGVPQNSDQVFILQDGSLPNPDQTYQIINDNQTGAAVNFPVVSTPGPDSSHIVKIFDTEEARVEEYHVLSGKSQEEIMGLVQSITGERGGGTLQIVVQGASHGD